MDTASVIPLNINLISLAERIYCEREIIRRIYTILQSPQLERLEDGRVVQFRSMFIEHVGLLVSADEEWKLGSPHLEDLIAHIAIVGPSCDHEDDLLLMSQLDELYSILGDLDELQSEREDLEPGL